jgi:predicted transcriptional regulator
MSDQDLLMRNIIKESTSIKDVVKMFAKDPYIGQLLVTKNDTDEVVGVIELQEIFKALASEEFNQDTEVSTIMVKEFMNLKDHHHLVELFDSIRDSLADRKHRNFMPILDNTKIVAYISVF